MDAQIIISREDNTDFLSLGFIQTDTSLVSALGGALANFAQEIGLAGDKTDEKTKSKRDAINFSRFQNGILASKIVPVLNHNPIILIAIRGYEGDDRELNFIVDYASELATSIVSRFEDVYSSIGLIPHIEDAVDSIAAVANQMNRKSNDKVRYFTRLIKHKVTTLLDDLWKNQANFTNWARDFSSKKISAMSQTEILKELARYFYIQCIKCDALLPLMFGSTKNPLNELTKLIDRFLNKKTTIARKEIVSEITKAYTQLKDSSKSLSKRGTIELPEVELINESSLFEKILVTKNANLATTMAKLLSSTNQELYRKLFRKYPLKFVSMLKESVFDKSDLDIIVNSVLPGILKEELTDKTWISEKILLLLREASSKYLPNEVMKQKDKILEKIQVNFINTIKKEHPFILFADSQLTQLTSFVKSDAIKSLERYKTSQDEAVVLYNIIGQIRSNLTSERSSSTQDLMILYFLQSVIQPYQFRDVPDIVYALITDCLEKTSYARRDKPIVTIQNSIRQLEKNLNFQLIQETKSLVLRRITKTKATNQRFENFENLAYFFQSFRVSLESTIARILQTIFGSETFPNPPTAISNLIKELSTDLQSISVIKRYIDQIIMRPNGRELFSKDNTKFIAKNTRFKQILPAPIHLALVAYNSGWIKSADDKKREKLTTTQLSGFSVKIPSLKLEGKVSTLIENPKVLENLWVRYAFKIIESRQKSLKKAIDEIEKKTNVTAGLTSGQKKYGKIAKRLKDSNRWLGNIVSGGGFMRKIFSGRRDLNQLAQEIAKTEYYLFTQLPESYNINKQISTIRSSFTNPISNDFQDLIEVYASLWMADSEYIDNLTDKLFWNGLLKSNGKLADVSDLNRKINQNLKASYRKDTITDKKTVIRRAIIEEVVPVFNKMVRQTLAVAFNLFSDYRAVKFDENTNNWYISLDTLILPPSTLKFIFNNIKNLSFVKNKDDLTEVRLILTPHYSLKRSKESQTIEEFIRKASYGRISKNEVRALEFFSKLSEKYIGKSAANTFYSNLRSLSQIIITTVE
ncbi:MAG: hypothetical protein GPJ52_09370 [Candidatus Heimdallarchaeota archaeon]|nr:hypothetical protein [Candidatus Heimdallarchaeota archaeon]